MIHRRAGIPIAQEPTVIFLPGPAPIASVESGRLVRLPSGRVATVLGASRERARNAGDRPMIEVRSSEGDVFDIGPSVLVTELVS